MAVLKDKLDFDDEDAVLEEMAHELDCDPEDLTIDDEGRGFSGFGVGTFYLVELGSKEYIVARDDDEVHELAVEVVKQDLEEDPSLFNQSFIESHIDTDKLKRELKHDVMSSNEDRVREMRTEEFWDEAERFGMDVPEEDEDGELPDPEDADLDDLAERMTDQELEDPMQYLEDIYGSEDAVKQAIEIAGIDVDAAAKEAVSSDGEGHFLSSYDGNINETKHGLPYWRVN